MSTKTLTDPSGSPKLFTLKSSSFLKNRGDPLFVFLIQQSLVGIYDIYGEKEERVGPVHSNSDSKDGTDGRHPTLLVVINNPRSPLLPHCSLLLNDPQ